MAVKEWTRMKANGSRECRNCHHFDAMEADKQSERAQARHTKAKADGTPCIDCHFGIAHNEPDGPGPREIKVAK
jgi:cytochrome c-type protein NapC